MAGAADFINKRYGTKSGGTLGEAANAIAQSNMPLLLSVGNATGHEDAASMAVKLTLSAAGMARSIIQHGAKSGIDDIEGTKGQPITSASTQPFSRFDSDKDFYFRCGDYYMPLSIIFTLKASKNLAESQLIDGAHIIERVSKAPKTIDVTIRLERKRDEQPSPLHIVNEANRYNPIADISAMIRDLYETRDVFKIDNTVLNGELGVHYVVMRDFMIVPSLGSTLMTLQMTLIEIDINANIINNEENSNGSGEILPDTQGFIT